jgi:hypothetical protein
MPKFTVSRKMIQSTMRDVKVAGEMIQYLAGLAKAMNDAGLLYPARHPLTRIPARIPSERPNGG